MGKGRNFWCFEVERVGNVASGSAICGACSGTVLRCGMEHPAAPYFLRPSAQSSEPHNQPRGIVIDPLRTFVQFGAFSFGSCYTVTRPNRYHFKRSKNTEKASEMNATQTVPRFLLPRLSWTSPLSTTTTVTTSLQGAFSVALRQTRNTSNGAGGQAVPRRCIHTGGPNPARRQGILRENADSQPTRTLSSIVRNPALRRSFHETTARRRDHHFDTLRFVQRLQQEGFTEEQSVAMMKVLNDVIEERSAAGLFS